MDKSKIIEQKEMILSDFNFDKIYRTMIHLGIEWSINGNKSSIPSLCDLKEIASLCMDEAIKNKKYSLGSFESEIKDGTMNLKFILEHANIFKPILKPHSEENPHKIDKEKIERHLKICKANKSYKNKYNHKSRYNRIKTKFIETI